MSKRKKFGLTAFSAFAVIALVVTGLVIAAPGAYEPDTGFEVDGNIAFDDDGGNWDWSDGSHQPDYPPAILIGDIHSKNAPDNYFSPSGKFDNPAGWSIKEGSVGPGQNELTNIFIWALAPGDVGNADSWLVMGMERVKKSGTFALDFELNQEPWTPGPLPHVGGPNRTSGDIAVGFELKGNPTDAQTDLQVLIVQFYGAGGPAPNLCNTSNWTGKGGNPGTIGTGSDPCPAYGSSGWYYRFLNNAAILTTSGLGTATMNAKGEGFAAPPFTANGDSYQSYDEQGNVDNHVGEFEFAEAAINLTALGLEPGCPGFGSVHAKSRSSLEVGSDLKDLAGPRPLPVKCFIEGTKYLDINGNGDRDLNEPGLEGWEINAGSLTTYTDSDGHYIFENLDDGSYTVSEVCPSETPPWVQTELGASTGDACGDEVYNFNINIGNKSEIGDFGNGAPAIDVTKTCDAVVQVGNPINYGFDVTNTGNVKLVNVDVSDPTVVFDNNPNITLDPGSSQNYTAQVTLNTPQVITNTVSASGDFGSSPVFASVSDSNSCTTRVVDARISIVQSDVNQVYDSHTFTVTVEKNDGSGWTTASGVIVTPSKSGVGNIAGETCTSGTNASGQCTVTVNSATPGSMTVNASATVDVLGLNINVATNGYGAYTVSNIKTWVDARISIVQTDTNKVNDPHTFTVTVEKNDGGGWVAASGVTVTPSESGVGNITGGTCTTTVTDASGQCTITVNSATPGSSTVNASATVNVLGVDINVATNGYGAYTVSNTKTWVDARISIVQSDANKVNDPHVFTVTVEKNVGNGWVAASGVTVTPSEDGVGNIAGETCTSGTNASGQCTVTVNSATPGSSTVNASATVNVSGVNINVATNGYGAHTVSNTKTWVDARISIVETDTNKVNDPHVFTVTVEKNVGSGWVAASGVTVTPSESGVGNITGETCTSGTNASGQCTITVNSATPGSSTVNASATVSVLGVDIAVATDGDGAFTVSNTKTWVDARISIVQSDTNGITEPHTFEVTVEKNDGSGWVAASGVIVTPSESGVGNITGETCTSGTDASGKCTVTVSSATPGISTVNASATVNVLGENIAVATDGYGAYTVSNTKTWVDGSLYWEKRDSQGNLLGGATFEVCRTHDRFGTDIPDECVTVVDNSAPDLNGADGKFLLDGLQLGRYTIEETIPPAGYEGDSFVETIELTLNDPDQSADHTWVNVPGQGCTPGWWKNQGLGAYDEASDALALAVTEAVADYWYGGVAPAGFDGTHDALFRVAFNLTEAEMSARGLDPNLTLLGAIELGGGGFKALARQGTSALLNSLSVAYEFSAEQVLQDVHDAFVSGDLGNLIDDYDTASNRDHSFCPTG